MQQVRKRISPVCVNRVFKQRHVIATSPLSFKRPLLTARALPLTITTRIVNFKLIARGSHLTLTLSNNALGYQVQNRPTIAAHWRVYKDIWLC